jgi:sodium-independent sulfate anion transporter 11
MLLGSIKAGLPALALPPFSINRTTSSNSTVYLSFGDICGELGPAIGLIPLIAILEQVAIAKAFCKILNLI